jgi:hypothetical protein
MFDLAIVARREGVECSGANGENKPGWDLVSGGSFVGGDDALHGFRVQGA